MDSRPIGVFDSGIGGLTVANAIIKALPNEEIIYFGDTAHLPYGDKSADAIRYYSLRIAKFFLEKNCKLIVIACNSAAAAAHDVLVDFFGDRVHFIDVINPLVEEVTKHDFKKVGVIATKVTIGSGVYEYKLKDKSPSLNVASLATPLLVPMIEEGFFDNNISQAVIHQYLSSEKLSNIEALLLACTHYPLIKKDIEHYYGGAVKVFDSNDVVSKSVRSWLEINDLLNEKSERNHQFYISDYTDSFEKTTKIFYTQEINLKHAPIWVEGVKK